jgi:hypothetical protein
LRLLIDVEVTNRAPRLPQQFFGAAVTAARHLDRENFCRHGNPWRARTRLSAPLRDDMTNDGQELQQGDD